MVAEGSAPSADTAVREIDPALLRYRVMAYIVGAMLLILVLVAMPLRYFADTPGPVAVVGPAHGFLFIVYLLAAFDLALRAKWTAKGTVLVLLAGTIPFASFFAERNVTRKVRAGQRV